MPVHWVNQPTRVREGHVRALGYHAAQINAPPPMVLDINAIFSYVCFIGFPTLFDNMVILLLPQSPPLNTSAYY